jgi:hypothetical protein
MVEYIGLQHPSDQGRQVTLRVIVAQRWQNLHAAGPASHRVADQPPRPNVPPA